MLSTASQVRTASLAAAVGHLAETIKDKLVVAAIVDEPGSTQHSVSEEGAPV
jgi:hypothetical protein